MFENNEMSIEMIRAKLAPIKHEFKFLYPYGNTGTYFHVKANADASEKDLKKIASLEVESKYIGAWKSYETSCREHCDFVDYQVKRWLENPYQDISKHVETWVDEA